MRIRGAKTELEEAGLETEGMASSTAKLRSEIKALSGVDIMLDSKTFKSTYQIMEELAAKWQDLTDIQQASVTELIAGKRQGNIVSSLMNNFDIAEQALETSLNSAGSAMKEHEKWQESLEARINKLKAAWQSLSQSFMSSDFLKVALDVVIKFVDVLDKLISKIGAFPTLLGGFSLFSGISQIMSAGKSIGGLKSFKGLLSVFKDTSNIIPILVKAFPNLAKGIGVFKDSLNVASIVGEFSAALGGSAGFTGLAKAAIVGKGALSGLWTVIAAHPIIATVAAVAAAIAIFNKFTESAKELKERIEEVTTAYKDQRDSLRGIKGDYNSSNEDSMISKYGRLSKGVNELGENVSLTASEYSEYQGIVNTIAEQIPSLVTGYNSQGDAILSCAGSVDELTKAYKNLISEQNEEVLKTGNDIFKDFENDLRKTSAYHTDSYGESVVDRYDTNHLDNIEKFINLNGDSLEEALNNLSYEETARISGLLDEYGFKRDVWGSGKKGHESYSQHIIRALNEDKAEIKEILTEASKDLNAYAEDLSIVTEAYFSDAFLGENKEIGDYSHFSDKMQNIINQVASGFDSSFYAQFLGKENPYEALSEYFNSMLDAFDGLSSLETKDLEAAFNLKTQFNGGDISYGEYVKSLENVGNLVGDMALDEDVKAQIKLSLGLNEDGVVEEYEALNNRLVEMTTKNFREFGHFSGASDAMKLAKEDAKEFLDSLSAEELSVATDVIPELDANATLEEIQAAIDREMAVRGLTFDLNLEVEATSIEAFNTALQESVSAAGLSSESIAALKARYSELESDGYNLSAMFEETSNGIHLNKKAVKELEQAYGQQKLNEITSDLNELETEYKNVTKDIENCNSASERASLYVQRDAILQQINDAATLAAQYKGLTSAYNEWLSAEEAGQERDMYENMLEGFENIDDEISRGWLDDGTIEFLELLTGRTDLVGKSAKELKEIYDGLDNKIKDTSYSIRDFFTVDEDGNSTSDGVYNFLDAIGQLEEEKFGGKDVIKRDKDGNVIEFDFKLAGGEKAVADALGISEELVQIMLRAADDAGFVVNLEGAYTQLADLKTEAETARDTLISLQKNGLEKLKGVDVNFDLNAEGNDLLTEQEKAVKLLDKFRNEDGTINMKLKGAQQALDIAEYLTIKLDDLTEPKIMQIDVSEVDEDLRDPIEKMQEIVELSKEKNLVTLTGDTKEIEKTQSEIDKVAKELEELDPEIKAQVGIDDNWDSKTIADKIEKGEIEIPAELELDVQMSDDLKDIRLLMMGQLGIADKNEVKLKVSYDIDESVVDELTPEQQEVVVNYLANDKDVKDYTPEQKEALVKYIADGGDLDGFTPEEKKAFVNYLVDGGSVEGYTPEDKKALAKYLVDGGDPDKYQPPSKTQNVKADLDSSEPDNYQPEDKKFTVKAILQKIGDWTNNLLSGGSKRSVVNGTANVNGTAFADGTTGKAFKRGDWSIKDSGTALVGELGTETLVRDGRYYTIGNAGAEFIKYKKGDIIFNHKQTEELFRYGKVTSGDGRGKAFVSGTAFAYGSSGSGGGIRAEKVVVETDDATVESKKSDTYGSSGSGGGIKSKKTSYNAGASSKSSTSSSAKDEFEETIDWIEIAISRIEREIDNLDKKANNVYKSWSSRNTALTNEINKVGDEIKLQQSAYGRYIEEANSVGLSSSWAEKVRNGKVDISTITDEALATKIKDYQSWYEKALDCKDAIEELKETEASLYAQRVENVATQYEGILSIVEHEKNMLEEYISQSEAQAWLVSANYYNALADNEKDNVAKLKKEKAAMLSELQTAMESGTITSGSESWYEMINTIDEVTLSIVESQTALKEYEQTLQQIKWEQFDLLQDKISSVVEEADFLIELLSNDKLYDDNGQLTDAGNATMGLHGQNYNTNMYQADQAAAEAEMLKKELAKDPYDTELEERYREMVALQQEHILAAEGEKEAIRDMVEEGINLELEALQEKIDKYEEALDSQKAIYDYQKKVKEQTEEIASLEKQMAAYSGDSSEEAKSKVQELKVSLEEAKANLEETEYDKYISDQQQLLDELYLEYETVLNARLDNIDALVSDMIAEINNDSIVQ